MRPKKQPAPFTIRGPRSSRRRYRQRPKKQPAGQPNIRKGIGIQDVSIRRDVTRQLFIYRYWAWVIQKLDDHKAEPMNDLLDLTKAEEGQKLIKDEIFDLAACIREATQPFVSDAKRKNIGYEVTEHPGLPRAVYGGPGQGQAGGSQRYGQCNAAWGCASTTGPRTFKMAIKSAADMPTPSLLYKTQKLVAPENAEVPTTISYSLAAPPTPSMEPGQALQGEPLGVLVSSGATPASTWRAGLVWCYASRHMAC
ncbi:hypothetical protein MAPG_10693 [Magnaporthiopsis poae ATCC 64411]|uniref:Uncharacterized protein n=1 Tax=Magnaporthiopsis poae (strain ATCC 64411 / 73-15) TaxID=644358 RepID=A0A0C4ED99_MAGP6|nr:hypothetical protein MAPG_10693 [Magnaporthiopsis poae ATCC 64411]